ncbi:cytochrome c oxidase assembly protein COX20, mitochondrial [Brienomyrus brachyistius]|uniref:cytochrome c oxidase assembly protein COX20, mitochondrial n=1 Tax=Brienomyrus brachyistius TaxID=42636 RepID=UPI0020B281CF|nr:cytochrome c oxidase assembly protein COX20, mitochondrial [Brienomyrus brachyistius]
MRRDTEPITNVLQNWKEFAGDLKDKMTNEEEASKRKPFKLLGILDVRNTPCARESILQGAGGSLVAGFGYFLATSRVRRSFDVGMIGFTLTTLVSWFHCRYNNAKLRIQQRLIQDSLQNKVVYEGTGLDPSQKQGRGSPGSS